MKKYISVTTTTNTEANAKAITEKILKAKLSPCIQKIPLINSTFLWKGKVQSENEIMLIIKTKLSMKEQVEKHINDMHSYDTPEIISYDFNILNEKYKKWFNQEL